MTATNGLYVNYVKTNKWSVNKRIEIVDSSLADNLRLVKGHISHCALQTKTVKILKGDWCISILRKLNAADKFRCFYTNLYFLKCETKPGICQVVARKNLIVPNRRAAHPEQVSYLL